MDKDQHATDLLPALALGCLDAEEALRARQHLARCRQCRKELAALEDVTGSMAIALPSKSLPEGLEEKIMSRLGSSSDTEATARSRRPLFLLGHPALSAAAAVLIVLLGAGNVVQGIRVADMARTPVAPGFNTIVLKGGETSPSVSGTMVLDSRSHGGTLAMRGLPRLDPDHQYQLWLVRDGERTSGGVFSPDEYGYGNLLLLVPRDFRDFTTIGITIEPAGGSPAPTGARVASGTP